MIHTELWRHSSKKFPQNKTIPQGTSTSIYCCVCPDLVGGAFYDNCQEAKPADYAADEESAEKLWNISTELVESKGF